MPSLYSQVYVERGERLLESERARRRLAGFIDAHWFDMDRSNIKDKVSRLFPVQMGFAIENPWLDVPRLFREASLIDVLDGVTVFFLCAEHFAGRWLKHVNQVLEDENLAFKMADDGSVHPFIDEQFSRGIASALAALEDARLGQARSEFESVDRLLRSDDGLAALRAMFACAETTTKVLCFNQFPRLGATEIDRFVAPKLLSRISDGPALEASKLLIRSFKEWVNASHQFRHGSGSKEPIDIPSELIALHIGSGSAFVRWLIVSLS